MPICYVVQESPDKNLLPARDFGEICVMLTMSDVRKGYDHCIKTLSDKFDHFRHEKDFLILTGDPIFIGVAMVFANHLSEGHVQVLRWDREHYRYNHIDVKIP
jgi:hypothetical protein